MRTLLLGALLAILSVPAFATTWGTLQVAAEREWTTEKEPRARVSKFRWIENGRVLEARHGFVSRLQFGDSKFADTVQRFVLDPKTGKIHVTYTYEDGRPQLRSVITIEAEGTAVETFTDAKGVKKRNLYKSPSPAVSLIERQELQSGKWVTLGTTRKGGLTKFEIAENKRRAEEARQRGIAQESARRAAEQARIEEEARLQAAYEQEQAAQQSMSQGMGYNMLAVLDGLNNAIQQQNVQQQQAFDRQMQSYNSEGSSSGGGITVGNYYSAPSASSYKSSGTGSSGGSWQEKMTYYDCFGVTKKSTPNGDAVDTIYYGIVTASRMDIDGARDLFRSQTGSRGATDTESAGTSCHPYSTRAEAQASNSKRISRDSGGKARQITGIDLTL